MTSNHKRRADKASTKRKALKAAKKAKFNHDYMGVLAFCQQYPNTQWAKKAGAFKRV